MFDEVDTIVLADGVLVDGDVVCDPVRAGRYPVNATARFVLCRTGRELGVVAAELADAHGLDRGQTRDDVLAFAFRLNRLLLVNVRHGRGRVRRWWAWLAVALRLAPVAGIPGGAWRRVQLDTRTPLTAAATTLRAVRGRAVGVAAATALLVAQTAALVGAAPVSAPLAVGIGVGAGLALHEAGHAAALGGAPAALVLAGPRTFVVHRALVGTRRRLVAAAGPTAPLVPAAAVATVARPLGSAVLALAACALGGHAVGLTVATGDGRAACSG
ncbi:MAG: hypothetical protein OEV72_03630 [Thermoleophilia bacterium]|nr:hypothetical protein [Thermoleophilia bacterium]MDH5334252.1 hypothetical protein [Thermoleophilia bacterium]